MHLIVLLSTSKHEGNTNVLSEAEKADRLRALEEGYKRQQEQIDRLSQQCTLPLSQQHVDAADPSNRRSSVASSMVPACDDDALTTDPLRRYPVDDITETTTCELHMKVVNISMKVAVGYAVPIGPTPTFHCSPVPLGYCRGVTLCLPHGGDTWVTPSPSTLWRGPK